MTDEATPCPICTKTEVQQLRNALNDCKTRNRAKDKTIEKLNKKVFILTMIAIGIAAIFGKETLDSVTEWLGSIGNFKSAADNLSQAHIIPSPGALPLLAIAFLMTGRRRRR